MLPSFFLKDPKSKEPTLLFFYMKVPGEPDPVKRSTGKKIEPARWSTKDQRPSGSDKEARDINSMIDSVNDAINGLKSECRRFNRVVTSEDVNQVLDSIFQKRAKGAIVDKHLDMFDWFDSFIELMKTGDIMTPGRKKRRYRPSSIKNFEKSVRKIKAFYIEKKLRPVFAAVTLDTYEKFLGWCHEQDQSDNSIGTFIKCWKRLARIAEDKGVHKNKVFSHDDFLAPREDTPDIWLDDNKLDKLAAHRIGLPQHEIARDWFILDCDLGLRISDLSRVGLHDFLGKTFEFINQKTGAQVAIPISTRVKKIIKHWKGLPPPISDQKLNEYIKLVAQSAGLKTPFRYTLTKGGEVVSEVFEEWEMISSHTCRRSFVTRLLRQKVAHAYVMKLAGIKRYETLMRYFKETPEEIANEMAGKSIFK